MSFTEDPNQTGQTGDQGGTDWETIFGSAVGGTASFGPDFKYTRRVVQGFGPNITPEQQAAIRAKIGYYGTPGHIIDDASTRIVVTNISGREYGLLTY